MVVADPDPEADNWRRLSPLTLLLAVVRLGPKSLNMIPAVAAIGITTDWRYAALSLLLFLTFSLGFAWAAWVRFRWRIARDAIIIESGIFDRQHRTIPFDRIQDVNIEQGPAARMLDLAKVGFETGASAEADKADGGLDSITIEDAAVLRATIRDWRSMAKVAEVAATPEAVGGSAEPLEVELYHLTPRRLVQAGLFNFSLAALAVSGAATQWLDDLLPFNIFDVRGWRDAARQTGMDSWIDGHRWAAAFGIIAALLFVGFATGLVRTALVNWNFQLSLGSRAFRRVRGLFTRTDVAIPLARVQAAVVATGLIRRRWGWHELRVQSLASDGKDEKDHQLVPFGQLDDVDAVLRPTGMARPAPDSEWHRPSLVAQAYPGFVAAGLTLVASAVIGVLGQPWWPVPLLVGGWTLCISVVGARRHRWAEAGATLYIWRGWWAPRLTILPFANIQSADLADGPVLRRVDCVTLVLGVPGDSNLASHSIDAVPVARAAALRQRILAARTVRPETARA